MTLAELEQLAAEYGFSVEVKDWRIDISYNFYQPTYVLGIGAEQSLKDDSIEYMREMIAHAKAHAEHLEKVRQRRNGASL